MVLWPYLYGELFASNMDRFHKDTECVPSTSSERKEHILVLATVCGHQRAIRKHSCELQDIVHSQA